MKKIIVGITGASGSIYAIKLIEQLLLFNYYVHVVISSEGEKVIKHELHKDFVAFEEKFKHIQSGKIEVFNNDDLFSSVASGSYKVDEMVIVPCSMHTVSSIAMGLCNTLLLRASQVTLKENRHLIIVPRETPYSTIFLENLTTLSKNGVTIIPATPAFYNHPKTLDDIINFIVGRILDLLKIEHNLFERWN